MIYDKNNMGVKIPLSTSAPKLSEAHFNILNLKKIKKNGPIFFVFPFFIVLCLMKMNTKSNKT